MRDLDAVGIDELARCREAWGLPRHNAHWWNFRVAGHCRSTIRSGVTASTGRAPSGIVTTPRCHFPHFGVKTAEAPGLFDLPGTGYNGSNPRASSDHAGLAICDWSLGDSFWSASSGRRRRPVAVAGLLRRDERLSAQVCKPAKVRAAEYPASVRTATAKRRCWRWSVPRRRQVLLIDGSIHPNCATSYPDPSTTEFLGQAAVGTNVDYPLGGAGWPLVAGLDGDDEEVVAVGDNEVGSTARHVMVAVPAG